MVAQDTVVIDQAPGGAFARPASNRKRPPRKQVADIQRARMLSAMVEVAAERGAADTAVAHVVARSGVSRRTFYEIFEDREDCFIAAFADAIEGIFNEIGPAYASGQRWQEKIRGGLTALLDFCEREPRIAHLVFVDSLGAGPRALELRRKTIALLIDAIDAGRGGVKREAAPPPLAAEGLVGSVVSVIQARLLEQRADQLLTLVNPLMSMIVLPYLGRAASNRELKQVVLDTRKSVSVRAESGLLREIGMRLTYRTVRVLEAVAAHPGGSNRQIGGTAGISDQGQISKLLARLQGFGLVENLGGDAMRGAPNEWVLTDKGQELHSTISQQTSDV